HKSEHSSKDVTFSQTPTPTIPEGVVSSDKLDNPAKTVNETDGCAAIRHKDRLEDVPIAEIDILGESASYVNNSSTPIPKTAWDTDEETYRLLSQAEPMTIGHSDPQLKLALKFADWRGRDSGLIGGFEFDITTFDMLDGWAVAERLPLRLTSDASPHSIEQIVRLTKKEASLYIGIRVAMSVGWAQQLMINKFNGVTLGAFDIATRWGDLHGIEIGDVWFSGKNPQNGIDSSGKFIFVRRNILLSVRFANGVSRLSNGVRYDDGKVKYPVKLDLMALARELDLQIIDQGLPGYEWADIADACPKIAQFEAESNTLPAKTGASTPILFSVDSVQNGDKISLQTANYGLAKIYILGKNPSATLGYVGPENEDQILPTAKVWLIAINERNLLFSVAEIEFTLVKPD
ncbi:MAG: hypothetical protein L3J82_04935, partial [Planctomycetes bacterium]|nr:hypothetical protein [Planctomycetota bacterium]